MTSRRGIAGEQPAMAARHLVRLIFQPVDLDTRAWIRSTRQRDT
jgi:hypothetical protein